MCVTLFVFVALSVSFCCYGGLIVSELFLCTIFFVVVINVCGCVDWVEIYINFIQR